MHSVNVTNEMKYSNLFPPRKTFPRVHIYIVLLSCLL